jgi:molybdopterin synthase sulfur carrier subunit
MKVLYFAWVREKIGMPVEDIALPEMVTTVSGLIDNLKTRGGGYAEAFADESVVRVAVNQEYVKTDHALSDGDEVAFFPPVTGG